MWRKHELLTTRGQLKPTAELRVQLVSRYSTLALDKVHIFVTELSEIIDKQASLPAGEKEFVLQIAVQTLHTIARMTNTGGAIYKTLIDQAQAIILQGGFTRIIKEAQAAGLKRLEEPEISQLIADNATLTTYRQLITIASNKAIARKSALLTRQEETWLGRRKNQGDQEALALLVTKNLGLVHRIAKRYSHHGVPYADLVQEGNEGLIIGIQKFDPERGVRISTYVNWWIEVKIQRYVNKHKRTVRLPHHQVSDLQKMRKIRREHQKLHGTYPSLEELSELTGIPTEKIKALDQANQATITDVRLDAPINEDPNSQRKDRFIGEKDQDLINFELSQARKQFLHEIEQIIHDAISTNPDRAFDIFCNRFGFNQKEQTLKLSFLGKKHGISRERTRQIEVQILKELRNYPELRDQLLEIIQG